MGWHVRGDKYLFTHIRIDFVSNVRQLQFDVATMETEFVWTTGHLNMVIVPFLP